jgi:UDP-2-acetamido-3-amino-2,3-dideoxy-glucuronate N-acetyltransferase
VPEYALVYGNPARIDGWVCECGLKLEFEDDNAMCSCGIGYMKTEDHVKKKV